MINSEEVKKQVETTDSKSIREKLISKIVDGKLDLTQATAPLDEKTFSELMNLLKQNHPIFSITFGRNIIDPVQVKDLAEALKTNQSLESLVLDANSIKEQRLLDDIQKICRQNTLNRKKLQNNWGRFAILKAFIQANKESSLQYSIFPLLNEIINKAGLTSESTILNPHQFTKSAYFLNSLQNTGMGLSTSMGLNQQEQKRKKKVQGVAL